MAISIHSSSASIITPDALLEWAVENVDPTDNESIITAADQLHSLYNNRDFIVEKICDQMKILADGGGSDFMSAQGTFHGVRSAPKGKFSVRSVVWTPPLTSNERARKLQDQTLSFGLPHDHNFGLLTVGYFGPGYRTEIYEYDRNKILGYPDESVDIQYLGCKNLDLGEIIYFRPNQDIHTQYHPPSISISLNLISQTHDVHTTPQYEFDVLNKKITRLLSGNTVQSMLLPFKMAAALGADENMIEILQKIASTHTSEHIRAASYKSLNDLFPNDSEKYIKNGISDKSKLVQKVTRGLQLRNDR